MAQLSISGLEKRFGDTLLYAGFSLSVVSGETIALLGPSGIGKSTLLRIIGGIDRGFSGTILSDGAPLSACPPPGFLFQDARLLPWLTVAGNLRLARPDLADGDVAARLAAMGLSGTEQLFPHALSGGMQRRVALARALVRDPALLLLDEPFTGLDTALSVEMQALVAGGIALRRTTALIVTHRPEEAARLAHRVLVLAGRPVCIARDIALPGTPGERSEAEVTRLAREISAP